MSSRTLQRPQRYATQFMLLTEKLATPSLPIEDDVLRRALVQTLHTREAGVSRGMESYIAEDIEQGYITKELARYLI